MGDPVKPERLSMSSKAVMAAIEQRDVIHHPFLASLNFLVGRGFVEIKVTEAGRRALEGERP